MKNMKKTNLGLPNGIFAALIFIMAYVSPIALIITLIYVALKETDAFVKISAKRAAVIYLAFKLLTMLISFIDELPWIFTSELSGFSNVMGKISSVIDIIYIAVFAVFAIMAILDQSVKKTVIDFDVEDKKKCPKCGSDVPSNAAFCDKCGNKF